MSFGRKRNRKEKEELKLADGIFIQQVELAKEMVLIQLLSKGIIIFLLVFGSIGGFLSAFEVEYNLWFFAGVILAGTVYFSVIYFSPLTRDLGYIVFFAVFLLLAVKYRNYINSGFYAIINELTAVIVKYFDLPGANEYSEFFTNRYLTITLAACFIGIVDALMLNITMLAKMRIISCAVMSILWYLIPVYLKKEPESVYVLCTMAGLGCVLLLKNGGHFKSNKKQRNRSWRNHKKEQKIRTISYGQSFKIWIQTLVLAIFMGFVCIVCAGFVMPENRFHMIRKDSAFKTASDAWFSDLWEFGIDGLFRNQTASGGIGRGRLGRNTSVRPDNQTDLIIKFAPYSTDTIYLKAYTGIVYGDNQWESGEELIPIPIGQNLQEAKFRREAMHEEAAKLQYLYENSKEKGYAKGIMKVKNLDAEADFLYYPYYTMFEKYDNYNGLAGDGIGIGEEKIYTYYPRTEESFNFEEKRKEALESVYLEVPAKNLEAVEKFCKEIGVHGRKEEMITQVVEYFEKNIPYTIRPGAVPKEEDVINYFLTENRKGYCTHFASAAVLIFRYLGIPARYVEGYAVGYGKVLEGTITEEEYSEYYQGNSELGKTAVVEVEVTDAAAHAWVEVYDENFGWKVVDVTPSSTEEELETGGFWSFFGTLFAEEEQNNMAPEENHGTGIKIEIDRMQYIIAIIVIFLIIRSFVKIMKKIGVTNRKDKRERIIAEYRLLCEILRYLDRGFCDCFSHKEQIEWIRERFAIQGKEVRDLAAVLERISYSAEEFEDIQLISIREKLALLRKHMVKSISFREKLKIMQYFIT